MPSPEPGVKPKTRDERRAGRRAEMVQAAMDAVRRHGAGVSVAEIAAAAGITKPVLYRHFTDRADLQHAVGEQAAALLMARIEPALQTYGGASGAPLRETSPAPGAAVGDARQMIAGIIGAFLATIEEEPELWRFVVHHPIERGTGADIVDDARQQIARLLAALLGDRLRELELDPGGAEVWAQGLVGMVQSGGDWWLEHRTMSRGALTEYLTTLIWGGLATVIAADRTQPGAGRRTATPTADPR